MAVKVLITREFKADKINDANQLLMELRSKATLSPGYVSGQTLISEENPNKVVVVSTWASRKRWQDWKAQEKRKEFSAKLGECLVRPEEVEVFLVGEKSAE
jgi:heme-degrading monooxygenase HmoA